MLLAELYYVRWLVRALLQVPYWEVFAKVDCKELAQSCRKLLALGSFFVIRFILIVLFAFFLGRAASSCYLVIEVQLAPFDLRDWALCFLIPYGKRTRKVLIVHAETKENISCWKSKCIFKITHQIEPHENAANKYPLSQRERAVGEFNPIVSIFWGTVRTSSLRCILNRPKLVEKKYICGSVGSNSISTY